MRTTTELIEIKYGGFAQQPGAFIEPVPGS